MIIVSQDRDKIINFDNITEIMVDESAIVISDDIYMNYGEVIATYKTNDRAKEVLNEIIEIYGIAISTMKYEMPKE